jgi:hypothetical protein
MLTQECGYCGCEIRVAAGEPTVCEDCLARLPEKKAELDEYRRRINAASSRPTPADSGEGEDENA